MKLTHHFPPHIRSRENNVTVMGDAILALLPLYFMACFFYGFRALLLGLTGIFTCLVADLLCQAMAGRKIGVIDLSPVVTGMIIPLLLPAGIDYSIVVAAGLFAILVIKQPFGGLGQNIFNPAAGGLAFVAITWPQKVFSYTAPLEKLPLFGEITARVVGSPANQLKMGGLPSYDLTDILLGNFPGPMGATNILLLVTCLIFLVIRKTCNGKATLTFLAAAAVFAFLFPRIGGSRLHSVFYELCSGILLFGAVFLISDPATSPKREASKIIYAGIAGIVTMLYRYFGGFEEGMFFAVLLMNAFVWSIDMGCERRISMERRKRLEEKTKKL